MTATTRTTLNIPVRLWHRAKVAAAREGITLTAWLVLAIEARLARKDGGSDR